MAEPSSKKRKNEQLMIIGGIAIVLIVAWWLCWIIVPAIPNGKCSFSAGTQTGLSGGGSCPANTPSGGDSRCPECDTPSCDAPFVYNAVSGRCECPEGWLYDTGLETCVEPPAPEGADLGDCCPRGYYWDQKYQQCFYEGDGGLPLAPASTASLCGSDEETTANLITGGICPDNAYFDTYYYKCYCYGGYTMDYTTGCCEQSYVT